MRRPVANPSNLEIDMTLKKHIGDLTITADNAALYANIAEVTGSLYIRADAQLPALTSIGGYFDISADAQLPVLTSIGGYLYIRADAQLPALTSIGGSLYIRADAQLPVLTSIGGSLDISADAQLPALTSIGGYLYISADAKLTAPRLETVSGHALPDAETITARLRDVAAAALASPDALEMSTWHTCGTTHCIAGWGIHQAGADGYKLEKKVSEATAGAILLGVEAANHFHVTNDVAREWLRSKVEA